VVPGDSHGLGLNVGFSHLFASFFSAQVPEVLPSLGRLAIFSILGPSEGWRGHHSKKRELFVR